MDSRTSTCAQKVKTAENININVQIVKAELVGQSMVLKSCGYYCIVQNTPKYKYNRIIVLAGMEAA